MSDTYQVVTNEQRKRVLFDGTKEDAHAFVEQNFPRQHVEPGTNYGEDGPPVDVLVQAPDGSEPYGFVGGQWPDEEHGKHEQPEAVPVDEEVE